MGEKLTMTRFLLSLLAFVVITGCSTEGPTPEPDPMTQSSAVSVSMPGFKTDENTTLRWYSDLMWVDDPEGRYERRADLLQQILQREFEQKGYRFVGPDEDADYDVLAVALLGELSEQEEIEQVFRLYPSLADGNSGYTKGNLLVAIAPAGTRDIVWRGAIEVFSDPSMQPLEVREKRMQWASQNLLSSIPNH